jgi:cytochrome P450
VTHRDARFFGDPLRFDPERWTRQAESARPRFSYFPFGGGIRRCIGESFALMEAKLLLASIALRWRLRLDPAQRIERVAAKSRSARVTGCGCASRPAAR